ncbi:MAG: DMT family transporter [Acidobacteria bacterium]|nr:DMT family transporter [Acidobacteriota bacterium]
MNGPFFLYTLLSLMVCFWSCNFIIAKVALREFPPLLLTGLRIACAGLFMWPVYLWEGRQPRAKKRWAWADAPGLVILGLCGVALNQLFFVTGLSLTSVAHSALIAGMVPIFVLVIAAIAKVERITARKMVGMGIALAGVAILKLFPGGAEDGHGPTLAGDLLIALSGLAFALFAVFGKRVTERHTTITVNTFAYVGGAVAMAPMTLWQASRFSFGHVSWTGWASLLYMAIFPSVVCYLIFYYALTHIAASRVSAFSYLQPVLATMLAVVLLHERITVPLMAGGAVIFSGVYLTERG